MTEKLLCGVHVVEVRVAVQEQGHRASATIGGQPEVLIGDLGRGAFVERQDRLRQSPG